MTNPQRKFRSVAGAMVRRLLLRTVRIGERAYSVPAYSRALLRLDKEHEPWLDWVYALALKIKPGAFIDVGVNQGQTLAKMLKIAPENRYIGFEPQPGCAFFADEFVRLNKLENCAIVAVALSDRNGFARLNFHSASPGDESASTAQAHRPDSFYRNSKVIPVSRGDDILASFDADSLSVIKIDVEGAELEVLEGLSETIAAKRPFIVFEVLNNYLAMTREELSEELKAYRCERARQISRYFRDAGYRVFNIRGNALLPTPEITPAVSADLSITDYLAIPAELVGQAEQLTQGMDQSNPGPGPQ